MFFYSFESYVSPPYNRLLSLYAGTGDVSKGNGKVDFDWFYTSYA